MTSKVIKSSPRPLEAWEAARPGDGVTTRRRGRISKDANTSKDSLLQTSNISDQFTAGNSGLYSIGDEGRKNEQVDLVGKKPARTIPQTGLGKGKSLPKDRRCSQTSRSTLLTRSGTKSRPECRLVSEENSHSGANGSDLPCELPQGFPTPDHVPNHASNDVGDHPDVQQEDSDRPSESTDLDGSTLQDIDGDVHLPDGVAITGTPLKVLDSGYPSDFESSDPSDKEMTENVYMDDINLAVDELCKANRVSSLIAGIALKGAILPNSGGKSAAPYLIYSESNTSLTSEYVPSCTHKSLFRCHMVSRDVILYPNYEQISSHTSEASLSTQLWPSFRAISILVATSVTRLLQKLEQNNS